MSFKLPRVQRIEIDLNGDNVSDVMPRIHPAENLEHPLPPDRKLIDLGGLKTAAGGFIRFSKTPPDVLGRGDPATQVVCTDPQARFYIKGTKRSFSPGQVVEAQGKTFQLAGISLQFKKGGMGLDLHSELQPDAKLFGYGSVDGRIVKVPLENLRWTVQPGGVVDPDRLVSGENSESAAEYLLKPLFLEAIKLTQVSHLKAVIESWEKSGEVVDPVGSKALLNSSFWADIVSILEQMITSSETAPPARR